MRIFLTGATGFIGSRITPLLLEAGHQVLGLTRSDAGAAARRCRCRGAPRRPRRPGLAPARSGEGRRGDPLRLRPRLLPLRKELLERQTEHRGHKLASEDVFDTTHRLPRKITEGTGNAVAERGVNVSYVRLPQVHDTKKQGLISPLIEITRAKGRVAYLGEGQNRWPAAHVSDVALLYKLAVERGESGARYNAVAEEGITMRAIAETLGRRLKLPVVSLTGDEAAAHFGWITMFAGVDMPASSAITREKLGWNPVGPGLLADLENLEI